MTEKQETITITIRATTSQRSLIDQAAKCLGLSRSEFMLQAACRQAEDLLRDQTDFALDTKRFAAFQAVIDQPPVPTDRLRRTLKARAPWDTAGLPAKASRPRVR